ncbi:MAG: class I SAM-dependent methyltransferase [Candidatus Thorarchaeota archaeon]
MIGGIEGTTRLLDLLNIRADPDYHVLELGCASGYTSCMVAERYGCQVTGIDLSEILIGKAQERAERKGLDNVRFQVANVMDIPFEDGVFDAVYAVAITALVPDKYAALQEYIRVTKPGGAIGTLDMFPNPRGSCEAAEKLDSALKMVLGSDAALLNLEEWRSILGGLELEETQLLESYSGVLESPQDRAASIKAYLKLVYHMVINGQLRKKVMKVLKVRDEVSVKEGEEFEDVGYLIFRGRKPLI